MYNEILILCREKCGFCFNWTKPLWGPLSEDPDRIHSWITLWLCKAVMYVLPHFVNPTIPVKSKHQKHSAETCCVTYFVASSDLSSLQSLVDVQSYEYESISKYICTSQKMWHLDWVFLKCGTPWHTQMMAGGPAERCGTLTRCYLWTRTETGRGMFAVCFLVKLWPLKYCKEVHCSEPKLLGLFHNELLMLKELYHESLYGAYIKDD